MDTLRQILAGILAGLISLLIILGSLSLAFAEGRTGIASIPSTATETLAPISTVVPGAPTFTPSPTIAHTPTATQTPTCSFPPGWEQITLHEGDSLEAIALSRDIPLEDLLAKNCLATTNFVPETILYVPPITPTLTPSLHATGTLPPIAIPTNTPVPTVACGPPAGWILYTIQSGDTLFSLSQDFYTTVFLLQKANCLTGTKIITGQKIYVPNVDTRTPPPSVTPPATLTNTPVPPTIAPPVTDTPTPTQTATHTPVPTVTPPPTMVPSFTPTMVPPTQTSTPSEIPSTSP